MNEPQGTTECPICGDGAPHGHTNDVIRHYREDQIRQDGWHSLLVMVPKTGGWYLGRGHVYAGGPHAESITAMKRPPVGDAPAEVLWFDPKNYGWAGWFVPLVFWTRFGEMRLVYAVPTHWRELPAFEAGRLLGVSTE